MGTAQWAVQWHQIHTYERNIIWYELRCHHVRVKRPALVFGPLCSCSELPTIHKTHLCCFGRPYMIHVCSICEPRDTANEVAHCTNFALKLFTLHTKLAIIFVIWLYCTHFKLPAVEHSWVCGNYEENALVKPVSPSDLVIENSLRSVTCCQPPRDN